MILTFDIDDSLVPSLTQYLQTQARYEQDELTKTQRLVYMYSDVSAFLQDALHQVVHQVVQQYPPDHIREQLAQAKKIQDSIKEAAKPKIVSK
jgi:hypothetical protein